INTLKLLTKMLSFMKFTNETNVINKMKYDFLQIFDEYFLIEKQQQNTRLTIIIDPIYGQAIFTTFMKCIEDLLNNETILNEELYKEIIKSLTLIMSMNPILFKQSRRYSFEWIFRFLTTQYNKTSN